MRRAVIILLGVSIATVLFFLFNSDPPEAVIRASLHDMASLVEKFPGESNAPIDEESLQGQFNLVGHARAGLAFADYTMDAACIELAPQLNVTTSRTALAGLIGRIRASVSSLDVELGAIDVDVREDGLSAHSRFEAHIIGTYRGTQKVYDFHYEVDWILQDGDWLMERCQVAMLPNTSQQNDSSGK